MRGIAVTSFAVSLVRAFTLQQPAAAGAPASLADTACTSKWRVIPTPNRGPGPNVLTAVSADSATDAWAVGYNSDAAGHDQTLALHWDGTFWSITATPGAPGGSLLNGVSALSPTDVWAVGQLTAKSGDQRPLIEHWDGTRWSTVPAPHLEQGDAALVSTSFDSTSDGWAVGYRIPPPSLRAYPVLLHWDGSSWVVAPHPENSSRDLLQAVSAASPSDVWAVGNKRNVEGPSAAWHWDGVEWTHAANVAPRVELTSVSALADGEAWGGGRVGQHGVGAVEHWTNPWSATLEGPKLIEVVGIAAITPSDIWAVDVRESSYFDGTRWREVPIAHSNGSEVLTAVSYVPGKAFAVGYYVDGHAKTLVETHC